MIEITVTHDGKNWIARNDDPLYAEAPTLQELDAALKQLVRERHHIERGGKLNLFMTFDMSAIPQWMRQYSQHYFNRIIEIVVGDGQEASGERKGGPCKGLP